MGDQAERLVETQLRAALPDGARLYANVRFVARTRPGGPAHDGEADIVVVHPDNGILVIETKAGTPSRDGQGRWFIGGHELARSPFQQAEDAKRDVARAIEALPAWPSGKKLRAGHAVAFPDADLASLPNGHPLLGPDAQRDIILDADALASPEAGRKALERAWDLWVGDGSRGHPPGDAGMALIDEYLAPTVGLHRLLRHGIEDDRDRLLRASSAQLQVLNHARGLARASVIGPAGSGKSLVAVEQARRLAKMGYRTLYVCFNQALATDIIRLLVQEGEPDDRRPRVTTFHRLCEKLGRRADTLGPKPPEPIPQTWWDQTLPDALLGAIDARPDERFHAIVVDEGQDFELRWLESLQFLLFEPETGVFWVFHDPGQALFRDDRVAELAGLTELELFEDYRCPAPVAELAAHFYTGPIEPVSMTDGAGDAPRLITAEPGYGTVDCVRRELHRLIGEEGVRPWQIVVLSGRPAYKSDVWRQRIFGNIVLWNGAIDESGYSMGLAAEDVPDEPPDGSIVLFETVRRFKGLERAVVILCELPEDGSRLDQLLYTGLTRATTHLVVIAPPALAARLGAPRD